MPAEWTWMLCDGQGTNIAELATASGKKASYRRNSFAEVSCSLSCEDEAAGLLMDYLTVGWPQLRLYRRAEGASDAAVVFYGNLAPIREDGQSGSSSIQLVARSPFWRMMSASLGPNLAASAFQYVDTDAGAIASNLILQAPATPWRPPLLAGTIEATKNRDITYPVGQRAGEAIVNLSNMLDGFDFNERYLSTQVRFDVMARQGIDQPNARFEFGPETMDNLKSVSQTTSPPVNWVILIGANGLASEQKNQASIDKYGAWKMDKTFSSISIQSTLDERALSLLRPDPIKMVSIVPEVNSPNPWDDYYLGDSVRIYARLGSLQVDASARVNSFTVTIDDNGIESSEIPDPTSPDEDALMQASLEVEVV